MFVNFMKNRLKPHAIPTLYICDLVKPSTSTKLDSPSTDLYIIEDDLYIIEDIPKEMKQLIEVPSTSTKLNVNLEELPSEADTEDIPEEIMEKNKIRSTSIESDVNYICIKISINCSIHNCITNYFE